MEHAAQSLAVLVWIGDIHKFGERETLRPTRNCPAAAVEVRLWKYRQQMEIKLGVLSHGTGAHEAFLGSHF